MNLLDSAIGIAFLGFGPEATVTAGLAEQIAEVTRASFADADPLPGLPRPDGAFENAADVRADLAAGAGLWIARSADGELLGSIRALPKGPTTWEVGRLGVSPKALGTGLARRLVRALESDVAAAGADRVVLDAVVERGNPPVYARIGYRTVRYLPNPDKPLSEVTMERLLAGPPAPVAHPCPTGTLPAGTPLVDWFATDEHRIAAVLTCHRTRGGDEFAGLADRALRAGPSSLHLGTDAWVTSSGVERWRELLAVHAESVDVDPVRGDLLTFGRGAADVAPYLMPRTLVASALALCRSFPRAPLRAGGGR
ncbi:GNAT family N-acetyltransferase [Streptomyces sp. NPDC058657]|uniref:GNAT family N-acetyltransferase n=1 Tax=unclassified Streptomyces TaxID=2593676 RepID=UPI00366193E6